nr:ParB N-terminal domain-containing protein [Pedobacter sp. ASV19]
MAKSKKKATAAAEVVEEVVVPTLEYINFDKIYASKLNSRQEFDQIELDDLAASIKKVGLIQPITIRPIPAIEPEPNVILFMDGVYEIVCGERRFRAAQLAGLTSILCSIRTLSDAEAMELMITENL